jgi:radical SAM/Cys-rich protein
MGSNDFEAHLAPHARSPLRRGRVTTLQLNIGKRCNLACHHCHVESGPRRTEMLDRAGAERVLELLEANPGLECLDITGGAPELNPHFRFIVERARALGRRVVDRCNLTVLYEPGQGDTAEFLADQGVEVVASLPCYTRETLERQRGRGVFAKSIEALRWLNQLGYAKPGRGLRLDLVYNPVGPALPPEQGQLEERYRVELRELFGIEFDALLTLANAPIKRFARQLHCLGRYEEYLSLLVNHFNPDTCRSLLSVDHDGRLYDCDFNQALELELGAGARTIWDLEDLAELDGARIATGSHCFACTAGAGSSCSGALVS